VRMRIIGPAVWFFCLFAAISLAQDVHVYTVDMTEAHTQLVSSSPYVTHTASGDADLALDPDANLADFVVGTTPGNTDPCYPYSPPHNLYAYKITDPCTTGPKTKVVIATGNHNTETSGSWAFQGYVDFLLSSDPNADWLRQVAEFYIYPLVNPDGRYTGSGRGNPEMIAEGFGTDHNRVWNTQGQGLSTIDALTTAMQNDTGGDVDYFFDFHSAGGSSCFFYTDEELIHCPYTEAFLDLELGVDPRISPGHPGMLRVWSITTEGLNTDYGFTPECNFEHDVPYYLDLGGYYALALHNALITDYNDLKILADNWLTDNLEVQTGELVGFWNFDDGTPNDSSGYEHHGTFITGDANTSINIVYDADRDSNVLDVNNPTGHTTNSVVDCGGAGGWANLSTRISIAAWLKVDTFHTNNQYLLTKGNGYQLTRSSSTNAMRTYMNGLTDTTLSSSATVNDGAWHHVAVTYDSNSSTRIIYIDGQDSGSDSPSNLLYDTHDATFVIGGRLNSDFDHRGWDGRIDDVRIYGYALTPNDVDLIYQGSEPCEPSGFICAENPDGDLNDDCIVNFIDYALLVDDWFKENP